MCILFVISVFIWWNHWPMSYVVPVGCVCSWWNLAFVSVLPVEECLADVMLCLSVYHLS